MDQDNQDRAPRRVKVKSSETGRTGTRHAAVKPHKRVNEPVAKQVIASYTANLKAGSLNQTTWGTGLTRKASTIRSSFGIAADDELYLLLDPTNTGKAGMLLSATGVHLSDGRGGTLAIAWKDFATISLAYQRNMLIIGQSGIASADGGALLTLLQQIQKQLA